MKTDLRDIFVDKLKIESKVTAIDSVFGNEDRVKKTVFNPPYQRNYVWDAEKATYFIESILIGTEIPPLVFFRKLGKLEIIDGRQRYETILRFMNGGLKLKKSGLKKLDGLDIENCSFRDLPLNMQNDFLETKIRIIEFSLPSVYMYMEDAVKQEIFKRYNSGITPLKPTEIDKAIYLDDDLNEFFKDKLRDFEFRNLFLDLFKYESEKDEILLKKIRQLLVIHKIPIKFYSVAKQKILDRYYELLFANIDESSYNQLYDGFLKKLAVIKRIKLKLSGLSVEYNRLYSECLFWGLSVVEDNQSGNLPEFDDLVDTSIANDLQLNQSAFKTERSSFAKTLVGRYKVVANLFSYIFDVDFGNYISNNDQFRKENKNIEGGSTKHVPSLEQLRINKPEPSTYTIEDICRSMSRNRFLIRPPYQRDEVINKNKSSEIIESLLLGIKLPPIFIFKRIDGICEVIDGQQRLLSILAFIGREYMNEKGEMVKSKKDGFSLSLKDGILNNLHLSHFCNLDEEAQDKILNFDLWTIEIQEKYNKEFEAIDLFVRLNNKPFPIKDDTFEMWNSYIDRDIIDSIKLATKNNAGWFYLRKKTNRMDNENLMTVLSYFEYLDSLPESDSTPSAIDIYKSTSKINIRLKSKSAISKVLESEEGKINFMQAIDKFEYGFLSRLRLLLSSAEDQSEAELCKRLDDLMAVENGKRTQQAFYALWYFMHSLSVCSISSHREDIKKDVKVLFRLMSSMTEVDKFKTMVSNMVSKYNNPCAEFLTAKAGSILILQNIETADTSKTFDLYLAIDATAESRPKVSFSTDETMKRGIICVDIKKPLLSSKFLYLLLGSQYLYKRLNMREKVISLTQMSNTPIPIPTYKQQLVFEKIFEYISASKESERKQFFQTIADKLIEELYMKREFSEQNLSLFPTIETLPSLSSENEERINELENIYIDASTGGSRITSELAAASGITYSYYMSDEKDQQNNY